MLSRIRSLFRLSRHKESYALNQIDLKLLPHLGHIQRGFFIEVGANDGFRQTNTLYYEKYYDWTGILIEPIPELAKRCRVNRSNCIVEDCALVAFEYSKAQADMQYCDLMSTVKGAMQSEEAERAHIHKGIQMQSTVQETYSISVPARTLTSVLDQHSVHHVDFFSLDVEGYELNVLRGLDFDKYRPSYILVEVGERETAITAFLQPLYEPVAKLSHHDVLYRVLDIGQDYMNNTSSTFTFDECVVAR